jgi:hypothetical protein
VTFAEAAELVLSREQRAMTVQEIVEAAIASKLIRPTGKTPEATMSAVLYRLPPGTPISREFQPGRRRAARGSVRWTVAGTSG